MEPPRFDQVARRLGVAHFTRRDALRVGRAGLVAAIAGLTRSRWVPDGMTVSALAEEGTPSAEATPSNEVNIDGMWLCQQTYALCSIAPCEPSLADENSSICRCSVEQGYSLGYTSCGERAPSGAKIVSTFSTQNVTSSVRAMICTEKNLWANCLDMPCTIDADDATQATCECPIEESSDFLVAGGDCDASTCASVIWSGASISGNVIPVFEKAMKQVNQPVTLPANCPSATPVSTPAS
jgi:hypothetical protein